jgi:protein SCO1/2
MTNCTRRGALWMALVLSVPLLAHAHSMGKWVRKEVSGIAPDFTLTNQDGRKISLQDLRGKIVVVTFIFTNCESGCLLSTVKMKDVQSAFKNKPVHLVSISFDPAHDSPARLKEYANHFGADLGNWSFLTGTKEEVDPVLFDYRIEVNRGGKRDATGAIFASAIVDHEMKSFIIDEAGMKRFEYWGQDFDTKVVIQDITKILGKT